MLPLLPLWRSRESFLGNSSSEAIVLRYSERKEQTSQVWTWFNHYHFSSCRLVAFISLQDGIALNARQICCYISQLIATFWGVAAAYLAQQFRTKLSWHLKAVDRVAFQLLLELVFWMVDASASFSSINRAKLFRGILSCFLKIPYF